MLLVSKTFFLVNASFAIPMSDVASYLCPAIVILCNKAAYLNCLTCSTLSQSMLMLRPSPSFLDIIITFLCLLCHTPSPFHSRLPAITKYENTLSLATCCIYLNALHAFCALLSRILCL